MEVKWIMIGFAILGAVAAGAGAVSVYQQGKCLQSYAQSTRTAEEISLICRGQQSVISISDKNAK